MIEEVANDLPCVEVKVDQIPDEDCSVEGGYVA